jgi:RNA polymerase sigma-70 factor (ECF subfamily)
MTDPSKIFDGLLVLQYRAGRKKALNVLVGKYHKKLCKHSYWYTRDIEDAKDIVQDSWSIAIKKIDSLKEPNLFGSWIFRIVTRKSLDYVKKRKREAGKLRDYAYANTTGEAESSSKIKTQKLIKAIQSLPKEKQLILQLFYMENYGLREISEILEISIGTVKSRLFHSREKLKTILK